MKKIFTLVFFSFSVLFLYAQKGTIRGSVIDEEIGETVIGANIFIEQLATGTNTDLDGDFSLDLDPGVYTVKISYVGYQNLVIEDVEVLPGEVTLLEELRIAEAGTDLEEIVVTAKSIRNTESALMTLKKKSPALLDGISSAKFRVTGDNTAVDAAKRVTGVSVEGGKYVYVRGLGDRYSKTTLNQMEIPGLDPDRNTLQMDIFPTNLIDNIVISKNFTPDMPADFTGGLLNIETKDFPEEKILNVSFGIGYNTNANFNSNYLTYDGGNTDFLGFDDGTRRLPDGADQTNIPTPISGDDDQTVNQFINSFDKELGAKRRTSNFNYNASFTIGNQVNLNKDELDGPKLGYIFSMAYRNDFIFYDEAFFGEYQRQQTPTDAFDLVYAATQDGQIGERNVLVGLLGGLAYKAQFFKLRLTAMRLQNGENRAAQFDIDDNGAAVGRSGFIAVSDNLEYNQRSLTNIFLNGTHRTRESGWEFDWRVSPTISVSTDPDIRKTAFTFSTGGRPSFVAGAGGNPTRIWRFLDELNLHGRFDITKNYLFRNESAKLRFGLSHVYKQRDYEILFYDLQFFGPQPNWPAPDPDIVLNPENIFPDGTLYFQSGNATPNPNEYNSNVNNTGAYISNEFTPLRNLQTIFGLRAEYFVQRHTGRDVLFAQGNPAGRNLDNAKVLDALDLFPSAILIYSIGEQQNMNIRGSYSRTIARPSFKELSFANILDPVSNRTFIGSLFPFGTSENPTWDGNLTETRINNFDLRWEYFLQGGQIFSVSGFFKSFDDPIELVRIPEQQTGTEFQPRNVGDATVFGIELEVRKNLDFISPSLANFMLSGNFTLVRSEIDMTETEFNSRKNFEREGETIEDTRPMAGQSPYVINAGLSYSNPEKGWDAGLFYNVKGPTLTVVGIGLYPDVFDRQFHSLNFSLIKKFGRELNTAVSFRVDNILNDKVERYFDSFMAPEELFSSINPGISFSLGVSHDF